MSDLVGIPEDRFSDVVAHMSHVNLFRFSHRHAQDHRCKVLQAKKVETSNISKTAQHVNQILGNVFVVSKITELWHEITKVLHMRYLDSTIPLLPKYKISSL